MNTLILCVLFATTTALPVLEYKFTRQELNKKATDIENFIMILDKIKFIISAPTVDDEWEKHHSKAQDLEAFLAAIELLKIVMKATESDWRYDVQEEDLKNFLDILEHFKIWTLATRADAGQLTFKRDMKETYISVLTLIDDIQHNVHDEIHDKEEFLSILDRLKKTTLSTNKDLEQLVNIEEIDKDGLNIVYKIYKSTAKLIATYFVDRVGYNVIMV